MEKPLFDEEGATTESSVIDAWKSIVRAPICFCYPPKHIQCYNHVDFLLSSLLFFTLFLLCNFNFFFLAAFCTRVSHPKNRPLSYYTINGGFLEPPFFSPHFDLLKALSLVKELTPWHDNCDWGVFSFSPGNLMKFLYVGQPKDSKPLHNMTSGGRFPFL